MTELTKFDPSIYGAPVLYCILHTDTEDVTPHIQLIALRIVHILSIRKKEGGGYAPRSLYGMRSIATIVGSSRSTVQRAIDWLLQIDVLQRKGGKYWLAQAIVSDDEEVSLGGDGVSPARDTAVSTQGHKYNINNLRYNIYINQEPIPEYEKYFDPVLSEAVLADNRFVSLLKRPMIKYPNLWLNYSDLDTILETFAQYKLPEEFYNHPFRAAQLRMESQPMYKQQTINVTNWIISWALKEALELIHKSGVKKNGSR